MLERILPEFRFEKAHAEIARNIVGPQQNAARCPSSHRFATAELIGVHGVGVGVVVISRENQRPIHLAGERCIQPAYVGASQRQRRVSAFDALLHRTTVVSVAARRLPLQHTIHILVGSGQRQPLASPTNRSESDHRQSVLMLNELANGCRQFGTQQPPLVCARVLPIVSFLDAGQSISTNEYSKCMDTLRIELISVDGRIDGA